MLYIIQTNAVYNCNDYNKTCTKSYSSLEVLTYKLCSNNQAQRLQFDGPTVGPPPAARDVTKKKAKKSGKKKGRFTREQLRAGQGILTLQTGTNQFATQKGMRIGTQRHVSDIKADDVSKEGAAVLSLQTGTNKFASQKGMRIGTQRHVSDIKTDDVSKEGAAILSLQCGTNRFDSQKGMTAIGAQRHVTGIKVSELFDEYTDEEDEQCPVYIHR